MASKVHGVKISQKTCTLQLPRLGKNLKQGLHRKGYSNVKTLRQGYRANYHAFNSLLIALGATEADQQFLDSILRQGQTLPPKPRGLEEQPSA